MKILFALSVIMLCAGHIMAQTTINAADINSFILGGDQKEVDVFYSVPTNAILDVEPEIDPTIFQLDVNTLEAGGSPFLNGFQIVRYINISSNLENQGIYIQSISDLPTGMDITVSCVKLLIPTEVDQGCGSCLNAIQLSTVETQLIQDISSCISGDGQNAGYQITFDINGTEINADTYTIQFQLTIK